MIEAKSSPCGPAISLSLPTFTSLNPPKANLVTNGNGKPSPQPSSSNCSQPSQCRRINCETRYQNNHSHTTNHNNQNVVGRQAPILSARIQQRQQRFLDAAARSSMAPSCKQVQIINRLDQSAAARAEARAEAQASAVAAAPVATGASATVLNNASLVNKDGCGSGDQHKIQQQQQQLVDNSDTILQPSGASSELKINKTNTTDIDTNNHDQNKQNQDKNQQQPQQQDTDNKENNNDANGTEDQRTTSTSRCPLANKILQNADACRLAADCDLTSEPNLNCASSDSITTTNTKATTKACESHSQHSIRETAKTAMTSTSLPLLSASATNKLATICQHQQPPKQHQPTQSESCSRPSSLRVQCPSSSQPVKPVTSSSASSSNIANRYLSSSSLSCNSHTATASSSIASTSNHIKKQHNFNITQQNNINHQQHNTHNQAMNINNGLTVANNQPPQPQNHRQKHQKQTTPAVVTTNNSNQTVNNNNNSYQPTQLQLQQQQPQTQTTQPRQQPMAHYKFHNDSQSSVLTYEQVKRLNLVMNQIVPIHGRGNYPTLFVKLRELIRMVKYKLKNEHLIDIGDVRLNGGAASYVLAPGDSHYNDLDLIFGIDLSDESRFDVIRGVVLDCLKEFYTIDQLNQQQQDEINKHHHQQQHPLYEEKRSEGTNNYYSGGVSGQYNTSDISYQMPLNSCAIKEAYVHKMVKVNDDDRWSLISIGVHPSEANCCCCYCCCCSCQFNSSGKQLGDEDELDPDHGQHQNQDHRYRLRDRDEQIQLQQQQLHYQQQQHQYANNTNINPNFVNNCATQIHQLSSQTQKQTPTISNQIDGPRRQPNQSERNQHRQMSNNNINHTPTPVTPMRSTSIDIANSNKSRPFKSVNNSTCYQDHHLTSPSSSTSSLLSSISSISSSPSSSPSSSASSTSSITSSSSSCISSGSISSSSSTTSSSSSSSNHNNNHHNNINNHSNINSNYPTTQCHHHVCDYNSQQKQFPNSIELKFVDRMRRKFEFSVDSFQIIVDSNDFYEINRDPSATYHLISENFYPTVIGRSEYGNFKEALYHLERKLIATRSPEEIRGGGLLKYCNLLVKNYKPTNMYQIRTLERYMCSRFFIDFSDVSQQQAKLESYLANHFSVNAVQKYNYLTILHSVVQRSTVCLMNHELRLTLNMIRELAMKENEQQQQHQQQQSSGFRKSCSQCGTIGGSGIISQSNNLIRRK